MYILLLLLSLSVVVVVVVLVVSTKFGTSAIPDMEGVNYCYLVTCFFLTKGKSYGQRRPPLTHILRSILERCPDGGQILKVQHAAVFWNFGNDQHWSHQ